MSQKAFQKLLLKNLEVTQRFLMELSWHSLDKFMCIQDPLLPALAEGRAL
jgi:hypothetical protein